LRVQPIVCFEAFTSAIVHTLAFWVVTPCSLVGGYPHFDFGGSYLLVQASTVKNKAACFSKGDYLSTQVYGMGT
jgi:hypothetical protein